MNAWWSPWLKLAGAWVTAVVLCVGLIGFLIWQTSGPMGRRGQIEGQIEELSAEIARLDTMVARAAEERVTVAQTGAEIDRISGEVFGNLEQRLTSVLRELGAISRDAGLIPEGFSYRMSREEKTGGVRFGTGISVAGSYGQVRQLLTGLQASPQFLIIDSISFKGEEDPRSQDLAIRLQVSTYLADAEPEELRALVDLLAIDAVIVEDASPAATASPAAAGEALETGDVPAGRGAAAVVEDDEAPPEAAPEGTSPEEGS